MPIEYMKADIEIKSDDGQYGHIEGYGSVFGNVDQGKDIVHPTAFAGVDANDVKLLWQHDSRQPIGRWDVTTPDNKGLFMKGRLALKTSKGAEAYELFKMGAMDGFSIGYRINPGGADYDAKTGVRNLKSLKLLEVSCVTFPMNTLATATRVKSANTKRELEEWLRDAGLSLSEAKWIAGMTQLPACEMQPGDKGDTDPAAVDELKELLASMKGVNNTVSQGA